MACEGTCGFQVLIEERLGSSEYSPGLGKLAFYFKALDERYNPGENNQGLLWFVLHEFCECLALRQLGRSPFPK